MFFKDSIAINKCVVFDKQHVCLKQSCVWCVFDVIFYVHVCGRGHVSTGPRPPGFCVSGFGIQQAQAVKEAILQLGSGGSRGAESMGRERGPTESPTWRGKFVTLKLNMIMVICF